MEKWWVHYPWRMIQTNMRETDFQDLDPVRYVERLKEFNGNVLLLNACGIIASFDTAIQDTVINPYADKDVLGKIIDLCHQNNIKVIARTDFSKVRYSIYEKHPEWACRTYDGQIINYNDNVHVCPNSYYHEQVKLDILDELFKRYDFDGLFTNMGGFLSVDYSYNYYGPCYCDTCKARYKAMFGEDMPAVSKEFSPALMKILKFQGMCNKQHKEKLVQHIRAINPNIAISGVDFMRNESNTEIDTPYFAYNASSFSRLGSAPDGSHVSDNPCVDYMGFRYRHSTISPKQIGYRFYQSLANAGTLSYYIIGNFDTHMDTSAYSEVKKAYSLHKKYENIYANMSLKGDVLLVRRNALSRTDSEGEGWVRVLTELHIPFNEINMNELKEDSLQGKRAVIVYDNRNIGPDKQALLDHFVEEGGQVLATGDTTALQSLGIVKVVEKRKDVQSSVILMDKKFESTKETPLVPYGTEINICEYADTVVGYNQLVKKHPFGPPELCYFKEVEAVPSVTVNAYGKGQGIYLPTKIAAFYAAEGYSNTLGFFKTVLLELMKLTSISNTSEMVELTVSKVGEATFVQLVNGSGHFGNSYFAPLPIENVLIKLDIKKIGSIKTLCGGKVSVKDNMLCLDVLNDYEGILIEEE